MIKLNVFRGTGNSMDPDRDKNSDGFRDGVEFSNGGTVMKLQTGRNDAADTAPQYRHQGVTEYKVKGK